jgi:hypothetical protein
MIAATGLSVTPMPGYDFDSRTIITSQKNNLPLLNLRPYPARRVSSPARPEIGVQFVQRTPGEKIAESVLPGPGPQSFGAPVELADMLIFAQTRYPLPTVALSPWQDITPDTFTDMRRTRPWLSFQDGPQILDDLKNAQHQWLRQNGYIGVVRTHVNQAAFRGVEGEAPIPGEAAPMPSGVIRLRPTQEAPGADRAERPVPTVMPMIPNIAEYLADRATPSAPEVAAAQ